MVLDEQRLDTLVAECQQSGNFSPLKQTLWDVFSSADSLGNSWPAAAVAGSSSAAVSSSALLRWYTIPAPIESPSTLMAVRNLIKIVILLSITLDNGEKKVI